MFNKATDDMEIKKKAIESEFFKLSNMTEMVQNDNTVIYIDVFYQKL